MYLKASFINSELILQICIFHMNEFDPFRPFCYKCLGQIVVFIKAKPDFTFAPTYIFNMIKYVVEINDERITKVTHSVIQRNSYSLHSENILCAMLTDP